MSSSSSSSSLKQIGPAECEYFAEEEIVSISSGVNFNRKLRFISGTFGPIGAGEPADVPLWFAIELRRKGKCTIIMPEWMKADYLISVVTRERGTDGFVDLPLHYIEIAKLLLANAKEDMENPDKVAVLIQDIENIRMHKLKEGCKKISEKIVTDNVPVSGMNINNISALEIFAIKGFLIETFDSQNKLFSQTSEISGGGGSGVSPRGGFQDNTRLGEATSNQAATGMRRDGPLRRFRADA